jgi:hypothetical protein
MSLALSFSALALALLQLPGALAQATGTWTKVSLPGTRCLDGSPGAYYLRPPTAPGPGPPAFLIFHEGGGWCGSDDNCYARSLTDLGSSKNYPDVPPNAWPPGCEAPGLFALPAFANAHIAYAKYCTGDSWTGSQATPAAFNGSSIYYQGRAMLDGLFTSLLARGLASASAVLYSGCSAGALTALSHVDYLATLLPPGLPLLGLADAMFALHAPAYPGPPATTYLSGLFDWGFTAWNASGSVQAGCLAHYGVARGSECLYGAQVAPFVRTPLLIVQSRYDTWQGISIVGVNATACPATVAPNGSITLCLPQYSALAAYWEAYGAQLAGALAALPARHGAFLTNCPTHCQTGYGWPNPSGSGAGAGTLAQAFAAWWPAAVAHGQEPGWAAPRFLAGPSDGCVRG